jgi:hypothetical protein
VILRQALAGSILAALLVAPISSAGQTVGTATGSIVGAVRDATGALLPNVKITISSDALMGLRTTSTAADGSYRIPICRRENTRFHFRCAASGRARTQSAWPLGSRRPSMSS